MDYYRTIADSFQSTIENIAVSVDVLAQPLQRSSQLMTEALLADHKVLACGNGVDGALAQVFTGHLQNRFEQDRPALPALSLNADGVTLSGIASQDGLDEIYARQLRALGQAGDILLCVNSGAEAANLQRAVQVARERNMGVIALSNDRCRELGGQLGSEDVELCVPGERSAGVLELQLMVIHCLCQLLDLSLFGAYNQD